MVTETKNYRKTLLTLPVEVAIAFSLIDSRDIETRNDYLRALRSAGWTLQSISEAAGITRERVRQIVKLPSTGVDTSAYPLPEPPEHPVTSPRVFVEPDPDKLARLLELQPLAQQVRSYGLRYRAEAEEYTNLIAEVHLQDGVTLYRLAMRLGVTHGALRFRLARYGKKAPKTGTSKVYTPIIAENRS
jgi:hypothetical protein